MEAVNKLIRLSEDSRKAIAQTFINLTRYDCMPRVVWNYKGEFIYVNDLFADGLEIDKREIMGAPFGKFIHPDDLARSLEYYQNNIIIDGVTIIAPFTNRYIKGDGSIVKVNWLKGFNDANYRIGSGQCEFLNIDGDV